MKNTSLKKLIRISAVVLVLAMVLGMSVVTALAEENLVPGPTVMRDTNSPTGYTVRFAYQNATATSVTFVGDILLRNWANPADTKVYQPSEYQPGFMRGGGAYTAAMEKRDGGYWVIDVPLAAGANQYWFYVNGNTNLWVTDPANSPIYAPDGLTGTARRAFNAVYVPYDPDKQNYEPMGARVIENPRTDGEKGTWGYVAIPTQIGGRTRYLGVYLPYGYDPDREEPYKTIYMQHGGGQDASDWLNIGSVPNIMDNLLAEGLTEPAIVVATDSTYLGNAPAYPNLFDIVIPFVESNYNVSKEAADRSFAGLSMGGMITANIINYDCTKFGYYGVWSGGVGVRNTTPNLKSCNILFGGGRYDFGLPNPNQLVALDGKANYKNVVVAGAHDFNAWCQLFTMYARDYLWQPRAFVNSAPVWITGDQFSADENRTLIFNAEATDPDGDELTYRIVGDLPSGASFDAETKEFTWTPDYTQAGTYTVRFIASDGDSWYNLSETKDVTITVRDVTLDEQVAALKAVVASLELNEGGKNALTVKLDQALKLMAMENDKSSEAVEVLNGFIGQVNGWVGVKLTEEQAAGLIKAAQETILNITSK